MDPPSTVGRLSFSAVNATVKAQSGGGFTPKPNDVARGFHAAGADGRSGAASSDMLAAVDLDLDAGDVGALGAAEIVDGPCGHRVAGAAGVGRIDLEDSGMPESR
jgi:hypothetical protein